jgi:hypothetical protein
MSGRRAVVVIVAVVRLSRGAGVMDCSEAACGGFFEVMVAERKGEVQRKRCKRKPRPKPDLRSKPPHLARHFEPTQLVML